MVFLKPGGAEDGDARADEMQGTEAGHEILRHSPEELQVTQTPVGTAEQRPVLQLLAVLLVIADFFRRDIGVRATGDGSSAFGVLVEEW